MPHIRNKMSTWSRCTTLSNNTCYMIHCNDSNAWLDGKVIQHSLKSPTLTQWIMKYTLKCPYWKIPIPLHTSIVTRIVFSFSANHSFTNFLCIYDFFVLVTSCPAQKKTTPWVPGSVQGRWCRWRTSSDTKFKMAALWQTNKAEEE